MSYEYRLTLIDKDDTTGITTRQIEHVIRDEQTWPELLPFMFDWLKGIGYIFDATQHLEVVDDNDYKEIPQVTSSTKWPDSVDDPEGRN
jgi:hypothetical protein